MIPTDKRQNILTRSPHSRSKHSIDSKSPPLLNTHSPSFLKSTVKKHTYQQVDKQNMHTLNNLFIKSSTQTPEFNQQDSCKFVYNCEEIYALLESVKIQRNNQASIEILDEIRKAIQRLGNKTGISADLESLKNILDRIQKKIGYKAQQKHEVNEKSSNHLSTTQHQIQFSLVSNWKQMTGKEVIYTNFSLIEEDQDEPLRFQVQKYQKSKKANNHSVKKSNDSSSSNVLISDLNLEIEMLDSLLSSKLKRKPRLLHPSVSLNAHSQTLRKPASKLSKKLFY